MQLGDGNDTFGAWSIDDSGDDTIYGGLGNDAFLVTDDHGYDSIDGGTGSDFDQVLFGNYSSTLGINVSLSGAGAGTYGFAGTPGTGSFTHVEAVGLTDYADTFSGGADTVGMQVYGGGGADSVTGGSGADLFWGGAGNDTLGGGAGGDTLWGGDGNDSLYGDAGNDLLNGGAGNDALYGGDGNDTLQFFDTGNATLDGGLGYDVLDLSGATSGVGWITFAAVEEIRGSNYGDYLFWGNDGLLFYGGSDVDTILAGSGNDTVLGGAGSDSLSGGAGSDIVDGGAGNDTLTGGSGNDLLTGGAGADSLVGGAGTDTADYGASTVGVSVDLATGIGSGGDAQGDRLGGVENLRGSGQADSLTGDAGANVLDGGAGNDWLSGGAGDDTLTGGAGQDLYSAGPGHDVITDFDQADDDANGRSNDQLDVSTLVDARGDPVKTFDVAISDDGLGNAVLTFPGGEQVTILGLSPAAAAMPGKLYSMGIPCFAAGTRIEAPAGLRRVEGDLVLTPGGAAPILWHGRRQLGAAALEDRPNLRPIRIPAGRFGDHAGLTLSPQHAVQVGSQLVRAGHLARWARGVRVVGGLRAVDYHHLLLPRHALIRAEGLWAESFYPGPMALAALSWDARLRLVRAIAAPPGFRGTLAKAYGPTCQPILTLAQARSFLAGQDLARGKARALP